MDLKRSLDKLGSIIVEKMKEQVSTDTNELRDSIKYISTDTTLVVEYLEYGEFVDKGTRPHFPNVDNLRKWCDRKNLNVWAVAVNISKFGTEPKPFLKELEQFDKYYYDILNKNLDIDVEKYIDEKIMIKK